MHICKRKLQNTVCCHMVCAHWSADVQCTWVIQRNNNNCTAGLSILCRDGVGCHGVSFHGCTTPGRSY